MRRWLASQNIERRRSKFKRVFSSIASGWPSELISGFVQGMGDVANSVVVSQTGQAAGVRKRRHSMGDIKQPPPQQSPTGSGHSSPARSGSFNVQLQHNTVFNCILFDQGLLFSL